MHKILALSTLILMLNFTSASAGSCEKCKIEKIKAVADSLNSLTSDLLKEFFCTFDKACHDNSEYSEWSNEVLFEILDQNPWLFLITLETEEQETRDLVLNQIENPVYEIELNEIYEKLDATEFQGLLKEQVVGAISTAIGKE